MALESGRQISKQFLLMELIISVRVRTASLWASDTSRPVAVAVAVAVDDNVDDESKDDVESKILSPSVTLLLSCAPFPGDGIIIYVSVE
jgi:hypothetical protein